MAKGLEVKNLKTQIRIVIPHAILKKAAPYAFDLAFGDHKLRVTDKTAFAAEVYGQLLEENEDGTTIVHTMLDRAMQEVVEQGGEGVEDAADD